MIEGIHKAEALIEISLSVRRFRSDVIAQRAKVVVETGQRRNRPAVRGGKCLLGGSRFQGLAEKGFPFRSGRTAHRSANRGRIEQFSDFILIRLGRCGGLSAIPNQRPVTKAVVRAVAAINLNVGVGMDMGLSLDMGMTGSLPSW